MGQKNKVSPEAAEFIEQNCFMKPVALSALLKKNFGLSLSLKGLYNYVNRFRASQQADNFAKVEAVRSKILGDADTFAEQYLKCVDDEIQAWVAILASGSQAFPDGREIQIESIRNRAEASSMLHKYIAFVLEFVKPGNGQELNPAVVKSVQERMREYEQYYLTQVESSGEGATGGDDLRQPLLQAEADLEASGVPG